MHTEITMCSYSYHNEPFYTGYSEGLPTYLFRLQTEGMSRALIGGVMTEVRSGELLLYKPGDAYQLAIEPHTNELGQTQVSSADYFLFCRGDFVDNWWKRSARSQKVRIDPDEKLISLWRYIILEKRRFEEENKELSDYLLRSLLLAIDRAIEQSAAPHGRSFMATRMKNFVEEHASSPFKLEDVARHVGLSVSRAGHLFKECFGKSVMQYAQELRLAIAVERMKYSQMTLEQIAETTGFGSYSYFHRVFRDKYGVTPSVYRERQ